MRTNVADSKFNEGTCHDEVTGACIDGNNASKTGAVGTWEGGGTCETQASPITKCANTTDCTATGIGTICDPSGLRVNVEHLLEYAPNQIPNNLTNSLNLTSLISLLGFSFHKKRSIEN